MSVGIISLLNNLILRTVTGMTRANFRRWSASQILALLQSIEVFDCHRGDRVIMKDTPFLARRSRTRTPEMTAIPNTLIEHLFVMIVLPPAFSRIRSRTQDALSPFSL